MITTGARKLMRRLFDNGWSFEDACHELGLSSRWRFPNDPVSAGSIAEHRAVWDGFSASHRAVWDGFSASGGGVR